MIPIVACHVEDLEAEVGGRLVVEVAQHEQLLLLAGLGCGREHAGQGSLVAVGTGNVEVVNAQELEAGGRGCRGEDGARGVAVLDKSEKAASDVLLLTLVVLGRRRRRSPSALAFVGGPPGQRARVVCW